MIRWEPVPEFRCDACGKRAVQHNELPPGWRRGLELSKAQTVVRYVYACSDGCATELDGMWRCRCPVNLGSRPDPSLNSRKSVRCRLCGTDSPTRPEGGAG